MSSRPPIEYERIADEAWAGLAAGADDPADPMRLGVLATVNPDEGPDARLLILRGASRPEARLWFHSDSRSKKIVQARAAPTVVALFYDPRDGVQLRVYGEISVHTSDELAERHWQQLELAARSVFAQPRPPGAAAPRRDPRFQAKVKELGQTGKVRGRENFAVLQLDIDTIDWLQVCADADRRAVLRRTEGWEATPLCP